MAPLWVRITPQLSYELEFQEKLMKLGSNQLTYAECQDEDNVGPHPRCTIL